MFSGGFSGYRFLNSKSPAVSVRDKNTANNQHLLTKNGHKIEKSGHKPRKQTKKSRLHFDSRPTGIKNKYIKSEGKTLFLFSVFRNFTLGNIGQTIMLVVLAQVETYFLAL